MHIKLFETEKDFYNGKSELETPSVSLINESDKVILSSDSLPSVSVDLGLPSGNIWATMNIGARSIEEAGMFFSWGNVDGHFDVDNINWNSNTYSNTTGQSINGSIPVNATYDAALSYLGGDWKIPTKTEFLELIDNCTSLQCTIKGREGILFISNINGKSIFFPASGCLEDLLHNNFNNIGFYWSSTPFNKVSSYCLESSNCSIQNLSHGYNIRPVLNVYDSKKIIIYKALTKLREVNNPDDPGIYVNGFNTTIELHTFENRIGIIKFLNSITSINNSAFSGCEDLISVTIPNSVTLIGDAAFAGCNSLTSVTIPDSLTSISSNVFSGCKGLTSITIPNSVTSIGGSAFSGCTGLTSINIPNSVTTIGSHAFYSCTGLTSITIPNSVTTIEGYTFSGCTGLTSVTIGNSVTSINDYAFKGCSRLTTVTIPISVTSIKTNAFEGCNALNNVIVPISDYAAFCNNVTLNLIRQSIRKPVQLIDNNNSEIIEFVIPEGVTKVGNYAFYACSGLSSITIPNSVTSIGKSAFDSCSALTSVTIPNSVKTIGNNAFWGCSSLTSVTIPNSVTSIGSSAFYNCSGLTSVTIGNSVTTIGGSAFYGCSSLTSITIGNSVTSIGNNAFLGCSSLTSVHISDIAAWCCIDFKGMDSNPLEYAHQLYVNGEEVKDLVIPNSVTYIGNEAFHGCRGLTSITIPHSVTSIGELAFYYCSGLTSVTIPNSVTSIGDNAFGSCSGLTSITIGNSVTSIGDFAFGVCSGLTSVTILATTPPILNSKSAFTNTNNCPIYVPSGSVDAYKAANKWSSLASRIQAIPQ